VIVLRTRTFEGRLIEHTLDPAYALEDVTTLVSEAVALNLPVALLTADGTLLEIESPRLYELLSVVDASVVEGF
jgi:hypothetical protein